MSSFSVAAGKKVCLLPLTPLCRDDVSIVRIRGNVSFTSCFTCFVIVALTSTHRPLCSLLCTALRTSITSGPNPRSNMVSASSNTMYSTSP